VDGFLEFSWGRNGVSFNSSGPVWRRW